MAEERKVDRLLQLDALRGVACLLVLLAHLKSVSLLKWIPDVAGVTGVGIFFSLSGFLITRILLADRRNDHGLAGFYNRRVARIFPIYFLTLAVLWFTWPGKELGWCASFTFNFRYLASSRDYFQVENVLDSCPPVAHFWSLCVEEHFYWIWPLAIMLLPLAICRWLPVVIVAATPFFTYWLADQLHRSGFSAVEVDGLISRLTPTQLPAICIGSLTAFHEQRLRETFSGKVSVGIGILLSAIGLIVMRVSSPYSSAMSTTALHLVCSGVFLVVLGCPGLGRLSALCSLGSISYGLYLYHLPIYAAFGLADVKKTASLEVGMLAFGLNFLVATVSFRYFELPIQRWVRNSPQSGTARPVQFVIRMTGVAATVVVGLAFANSFIDTSSLLSLSQQNGQSEPAEYELIEPSESGGIHTVVLGSSHSFHGIAANEFTKPTYNLAMPSQDFWYDHEIALRITERAPALKRVIFGVSAFSFRFAIADADTERYREGAYRSCWEIEPRGIGRGAGLFQQSGPPELIQIASQKRDFANDPNRGWMPFEQKELDLESANRAVARHFQVPDKRVEENKNLLIDAIRHCESRGIECVLVTTPVHDAYRSQIPDEIVRENRGILNEILKSTRAIHLDYSADARFNDDDFYDCDHLDRVGAVKLARILDEALNSPQRLANVPSDSSRN